MEPRSSFAVDITLDDEEEKDVTVYVLPDGGPTGEEGGENGPGGEAFDGNNDECEACKQEGDLICCEGCPAAYHVHCLVPPLQEVPEGDWFCPTCVELGRPKRVVAPAPLPTSAVEEEEEEEEEEADNNPEAEIDLASMSDAREKKRDTRTAPVFDHPGLGSTREGGKNSLLRVIERWSVLAGGGVLSRPTENEEEDDGGSSLGYDTQDSFVEKEDLLVEEGTDVTTDEPIGFAVTRGSDPLPPARELGDAKFVANRRSTPRRRADSTSRRRRTEDANSGRKRARTSEGFDSSQEFVTPRPGRDEKSGVDGMEGARGPRRRWTEEETQALREAMQKYGKGRWKEVLEDKVLVASGRTVSEARNKWQKMQKKESDGTEPTGTPPRKPPLRCEKDLSDVVKNHLRELENAFHAYKESGGDTKLFPDQLNDAFCTVCEAYMKEDPRARLSTCFMEELERIMGFPKSTMKTQLRRIQARKKYEKARTQHEECFGTLRERIRYHIRQIREKSLPGVSGVARHEAHVEAMQNMEPSELLSDSIREWLRRTLDVFVCMKEHKWRRKPRARGQTTEDGERRIAKRLDAEYVKIAELWSHGKVDVDFLKSVYKPLISLNRLRGAKRGSDSEDHDTEMMTREHDPPTKEIAVDSVDPVIDESREGWIPVPVEGEPPADVVSPPVALEGGDDPSLLIPTS